MKKYNLLSWHIRTMKTIFFSVVFYRCNRRRPWKMVCVTWMVTPMHGR